MQCKFCSYQWVTASKMIMVSCPCCMNKNNNLNYKGGLENDKPNKMVTLENEEQNLRSSAKVHDSIEPCKNKRAKGSSQELPEPLPLGVND